MTEWQISMWLVAIQKVGFCMRWSMKWEKALFCNEWTFFDKVNDDRYSQIKSMMIFKKQDVYNWHIHSVRPVQAGCWDAFWLTWLTFCCPHWHISDTDILIQKCYTCQCHPRCGSVGGLRHDSRFRILLLTEESILT